MFYLKLVYRGGTTSVNENRAKDSLKDTTKVFLGHLHGGSKTTTATLNSAFAYWCYPAT